MSRTLHKLPLAGLLALALLAFALPAAAGAAAKQPKQQFYVSLGDSYAVGWQHPALYDFGPTKSGFDRQIPKLAKKKGYRLQDVNFGCGGATTTSILKQKGCAKQARAIGGRAYKSTQVAAAERFLRRHRGKVALVTVSIGGNDVTACARDANPVPCVAAATNSITKNVTALAKRLRKAGGKKVRIVGTTYPDVILGQWVRPPVSQDLAKLSVVAFQSLINPALVKAYKAGKGKLVDVTKATGAYTPVDQTTTLAPYGTIPVAVAKVCSLTWYCQFGDIHANNKGYKIIAQLVVKTLPKRHK
jgi:lysophospholipase L1-like esterase